MRKDQSEQMRLKAIGAVYEVRFGLAIPDLREIVLDRTAPEQVRVIAYVALRAIPDPAVAEIAVIVADDPSELLSRVASEDLQRSKSAPLQKH